MAIGTVKWFNATKGYGFIEPEDGGKDAFVHITAVERAGLNGLREGQKVEYELVPGQNGKSSAENLVPSTDQRTVDDYPQEIHKKFRFVPIFRLHDDGNIVKVIPAR